MVTKSVDVLLVGAGAMSATLGTLLNQLDPSLTIAMVERRDHVAEESTSGWNNAGTGHAAYCELNYTPEQADGSINVSKAYDINVSFELSLQLWTYLVEQEALPDPRGFIHPTPHLSFVWGEKNVAFLRKRYAALSKHHLFEGMEYSEDPAVLREWVPLVMEGRDPQQKVAATRVKHGTDVNFGELTRLLVKNLSRTKQFDLFVSHNVVDLERLADGRWHVSIKDNNTNEVSILDAKFVFLGAGGAALPLLQKSDIPEEKGYGGFPVSGQWLVCRKPEIVDKHFAKVYGKASIGAPPMSVPHLDTRVIDGEHALLFGPFAGFTTKFLKFGSFLDLFKTIKLDNLWPMLKVGMTNIDLIRYLITEVMHSHHTRVKALQEYYPTAKDEDWTLAEAGMRVQIIKRDPKKGGKLEFGTEVVAAGDGSLAALLGASPGASVAVTAMMQVIEKCFAKQLATESWQQKLKAILPSYGKSLLQDAELAKQIRQRTLATLRLDTI